VISTERRPIRLVSINGRPNAGQGLEHVQRLDLAQRHGRDDDRLRARAMRTTRRTTQLLGEILETIL